MPTREQEQVQDTWDALLEGLGNQGITYSDLKGVQVPGRTASSMDWVRASVLPEDCVDTPLRYHDATNTMSSAALCTRTPYSINWQQQPINAGASGSPGVNQNLGPSDMAIFSHDWSPAHILSFYDPNANYRQVVYGWTWNGNDVVKFNQLGQIRVNKAKSIIEPSSNYPAHGPWLYCKRDDQDNRYIWNDCRPGSVDSDNDARPANIVVAPQYSFGIPAPDPAVFLYNLYLYRYLNGNPQLCAVQPVTTSTSADLPVVFTLNNANTFAPLQSPTWSDYYTIFVRDVNLASTTNVNLSLNGGYKITQSCVNSVLRQIAMAEVEVLMNFFSAKGRINAQGVRVTDVSMLQYINGQICGATAWDSYSWYEYYSMGAAGGRTFFDNVAAIPGAITLDLLDGGYIYHKPTEITDFSWKPWVSWDARFKLVDDVYVPIDTGRPVKIIACTANNDNTAGNPTGGGASCFLTVATMCEWIPPVVCYPKQRSNFDRDSCADGIDFMGVFPDFTDNTYHWSDFVTHAAAITPYAAPVLRAAIDAGTNKLASWNPKLGGIAAALNKGGKQLVGYAEKKAASYRKGKRAR